VVTFGYDLEFAGRDAFVTELFVQPAARRVGWGDRLLRAAAGEARRAEVRALHLQVYADNAPALALYRRQGFEPSPRLFLSKRLAL
jgi:ribosomal protein S18 acetylase RimI-like enzyme